MPTQARADPSPLSLDWISVMFSFGSDIRLGLVSTLRKTQIIIPVSAITGWHVYLVLHAQCVA